MSDTLESTCRETAQRARAASRALAKAGSRAKDAWLRRSADALVRESAAILAANEQDVARAGQSGLDAAAVDRLRLDPSRIAGIAGGLREVAGLPDPVGEVRECALLPNGLEVRKVGVPLGVVLFLYESRPNVTADAAALCVKSGNAVILRGGKEAARSSAAIHRVLAEGLVAEGLPADAAQLVATPDREAVGCLLRLEGLIDLAIPRGGAGLIQRVASEARMPVLKHYQGICHVFVERSADAGMGVRIIANAKAQRPGVCNAAECLLVDAPLAGRFLPLAAQELLRRGVQLRGCPATCRLVPQAVPATMEDYDTEHLALVLSVKVVDGIAEALAHIARHGSGHTDAIVTQDIEAARRFTREVDSAAVLVNASTRFHDGGELGLGAEIGISTDKLHARGPCGLRELTSYKRIVYGGGQVRGE